MKKKFLTILILFTLFPNNIFAYSDYIIASGKNIGINLKSDGIIVVGTYKVNNKDIASQANIQVGDKITKVNDIEVTNIDNMVNTISECNNDTIKITYTRDDKEYNTNLTLVFDDNIYKTGLYVKDSVLGIGTLTFIDPNTKLFGALGHEVSESTTKEKLEISEGKIFASTITDITPSTRGSAGEKNVKYNDNVIYGTVEENTENGIFGNYTNQIDNTNLYKVAQPNEIKTGSAKILTTIKDEEIEEFDINILKINKNSTDNKDILFEITDKNLLNETGGIVQGMSGSPIIQDNKIIGCVTHVIVDSPNKGYGIFITKMLDEAEN